MNLGQETLVAIDAGVVGLFDVQGAIALGARVAKVRLGGEDQRRDQDRKPGEEDHPAAERTSPVDGLGLSFGLRFILRSDWERMGRHDQAIG